MAERNQRIAINKKKYGLSRQFIKTLKLPKSQHSGHKPSKHGIKGAGLVLTIEQIFHAKSNFSCVEKIQHLERL